jgi:hypothetical protein
MSKRRNAISEQFVPHMLAMLESPAYRVLSRAARMVLDRIEIEHMRHGGAENGHLPVTYDDFVKYGIHRHAIAPATRELVALGFVEITQRGRAGNREFRLPSKYRLTYRNAKGAPGDGTHEWRWIESLERAHEISKYARAATDQTNFSKRNSSDGKRHASVAKTVTEAPRSQWRKTSLRPQ